MIVQFQNIVIYHNITVSEEFEILLTIIFYIDSQLFLKLKDNHISLLFSHELEITARLCFWRHRRDLIVCSFIFLIYRSKIHTLFQRPLFAETLRC
jgi:hypothetical protein